MKAATSLLLLAALFLVSGCQLADNHPAMSQDLSEVLAKRRLGKWDLDTSGLVQTRGESSNFQVNARDEIFVFPPRPGVADAFLYKVIVRRAEHQFWIVRDGGFAGTTTVFGPGKTAE